jgi:RNA polymerase sigma-32 factor
MRMAARDASLDVELYEGNDYTLGDSLADSRSSQEELLLEKEEVDQRSSMIRNAMQNLNEREQRIICERILTEESRTLQDLADELGISRERVRQIEQNALRKLKESI